MKGRDGRNVYPPSIQEKVRAASLRGGKEPVTLDPEEMRVLGHVKQRPARVMRRMCIDCMGGTSLQHAKSDIAACLSVGCALWPYRSGTDPFHGNAGAP